MVAVSGGFACGGEDRTRAVNRPPAARAAIFRDGNRDLRDFGIMGARVLNALDPRSRYSFKFALGLVAGLPAGGVTLLGSASRSLVACVATCAMFRVISSFWPPRSMVTVARSEV